MSVDWYAGGAGPVLKALGQHFQITGLRSVALDTMAAADFFEVYKGVLPGGEVSQMVKEMAAGGFAPHIKNINQSLPRWCLAQSSCGRKQGASRADVCCQNPITQI